MGENSARIMVVDDTPANLEILEELFNAKGYRVSSFPRGDMALLSAEKDPPDLIFLDIMMPLMDGFEVCRRLKSNEKLRDIPVIFISALDDTANKVKAFSHGGVDYVTKPFQEEEVLSRMETHLKLRKVQTELERYNRQLEVLVQEKVREITESQMATLVAMSNLSEFRDETTGRHIERTRVFCRMLAVQLSAGSPYAAVITPSFIQDIYFSAPLHDIGKIGIPDNILLKPGRLLPEEFEVMKTHVSLGMQTLQKVLEQYPQNSFVNMGVLLTKHHHEKWNGNGYPDGLAGEDIPLPARIMAVADVYDALRSRRPYKEGFSHEEAAGIIREESGQHFDPVLVDAFLAIANNFAEVFDRLQ
ncbi:MAG: HD domain-containing phosphohydrolase [Eubacteriales bacterium]